MPGAVIHRFKAIKIDKHQGMSLMCTVYRLQQDTQLFLKTGAIGEMRQCIMGGAVAQLAQHFARFGDVLNHQNRTNIAAVQST